MRPKKKMLGIAGGAASFLTTVVVGTALVLGQGGNSNGLRCDATATAGSNTAQTLLTSLNPNQTGCLRAGNYTTTGTYVLDFSTQNRRIMSYPGEVAVLKGLIVARDTADGSSIKRVRIEGPANNSVNSVQVLGANDFVIEDSDISNLNLGRSCILLGVVGDAPLRPVIKRNYIHGCGQVANGGLDHGVYVANATDATVTENVMWKTAAYALQIYPNSQGGDFTHNVIDGGNLTCSGSNPCGGVIFGGDSVAAANNNHVENNVITYANRYNVEHFWQSTVGTGNTANNNCVFGGTLGNLVSPQTGWVETNNLTTDPLYTDRATRDYRLGSGSCLGKAVYDTATLLLNSNVVPFLPDSGGGGGGSDTGNLWVNVSGGVSPSRCSPACAYNAANAYGSFNAAYQAANNGDTICVNDSGSYPVQQILYDAGVTSMVTIDGDCGGTARNQVTSVGVIIGNGSGGNQPDHVTIKDMTLTGCVSGGCGERAVYINNGGTTPANNPGDLKFSNLNIAVGKPSLSPVFEVIAGVQGLTIEGSTIGPTCCGNNAAGTESGSPVGIRIGTADRFNLGWPVNADVTIQDNIIQGITTNCLEWLTGFGSCPQATCTNALDLCHNDAIQVYGSIRLIIRRNQIYHTGINGIFIDSTDPNTDGTIDNNMIGDIMNGSSGFGHETAFDMDGRNLLGTWNIRHNTTTQCFCWSWGNSLQSQGTVVNVKGNLGRWKVDATNSGTYSCLGNTTTVFSFSYNTFGSGGNGCGGNETAGDGNYVNTALAPANTMNLHQTGSSPNADNKEPVCSVSDDLDGQTRASTFCDAGADER